MFQFETTTPDVSISGEVPDDAFPAVEVASGETTIRIPASPILRDKLIRKPLELWFCLNEYKDRKRKRSRILAKSSVTHYSAP